MGTLMPVESLRASARDGVLRAATALRLDVIGRSLARGTIRVMNLHGTPQRDAAALTTQLRWVRDHFDVLDPETFLAELSGGTSRRSRPAVVFTFDDGLASNARVAAPILESLGWRAFFFVNPGFALKHGSAAREHFLRNIRPDAGIVSAEDYEPMDRGTV